MPISYAIVVSAVSVACTVLGIVIGMSNLRRIQRADDKQEGSQLARVEVRLDHITKGIDDISRCMTDIKEEIKEHRERIVRAEESTKQAHKRLDELIGRKRGQVYD